MQPALGFVLYVNDRAMAFGSSFDLAQKLAAPFIRDEPPPRLRIESVFALPPSQIWNYDYTARLWGEAPNRESKVIPLGDSAALDAWIYSEEVFADRR